MKVYVFRTVPLSIIRSFSLYAQQWYMSYWFADIFRAGSGRNEVPSWSCSKAVSKPGWNLVPSWSCSKAVSKPVWHIPLLCVQWKTPDDWQRNCPKHVQTWFADSFRAGSGWNPVPTWSCSQAVSKHVWHIPLLCLQWKTPDDGQRNCPKHVEFHPKNTFLEISASSWFYYEKFNDARSHERQIRLNASPCFSALWKCGTQWYGKRSMLECRGKRIAWYIPFSCIFLKLRKAICQFHSYDVISVRNLDYQTIRTRYWVNVMNKHVEVSRLI